MGNFNKGVSQLVAGNPFLIFDELLQNPIDEGRLSGEYLLQLAVRCLDEQTKVMALLFRL